jgi:GAF domain-containing protein
MRRIRLSSWQEEDLREALRALEERYGLSSEDFIRLYEASGQRVIADRWLHLPAPDQRSWVLILEDALLWAALYHRFAETDRK